MMGELNIFLLSILKTIFLKGAIKMISEQDTSQQQQHL